MFERKIIGSLLHRNTDFHIVLIFINRCYFIKGEFILQQDVGADAEDLREFEDLVHIGDRLGSLPFGYRLAADIETIGQFFL